MDAHFDTDTILTNCSEFTLVLGCIFLSIVLTGGTVITAKIVMNLIGFR